MTAILRTPRKRSRNPTGQTKTTEPWEAPIIRSVNTSRIRRIEEGS